MTIKELLQKAGLNVASLTRVLDEVKAKLPDLAGEVEVIETALTGAIDGANLAAVAVAIPGELLNIGQGKLDPKEHAGDSA